MIHKRLKIDLKLIYQNTDDLAFLERNCEILEKLSRAAILKVVQEVESHEKLGILLKRRETLH